MRQTGGRQLLQVVVAGTSRSQLQAIAEQCVEKLLAGASLVVVKQWVVEAKESLRAQLEFQDAPDLQ